MYGYWDQWVIALQTTDPFSRQRGRLRKNNQVIVSRKKKSKIKSGQGSQREARYPDKLVDCLSAARRTPTPTSIKGLKLKKLISFKANWFFMTPSTQQSFNTLTPFNFLFYSLHVSTPTGHPQVRYTISYYFWFWRTILTGERQRPPMPTARSPRRWWISRPKNLEDHPDHHEEIQIRRIKEVFIPLNISYRYIWLLL
jgi:hypothetical protein